MTTTNDNNVTTAAAPVQQVEADLPILPTAGTSNTTDVTPKTNTDWAILILYSMGIQPQTNNVSALSAWLNAEGSSVTGNNPLNSKLAIPGSTNKTAGGVQSYNTVEEGVAATIVTLGNYPVIVNALKNNDTTAQFVAAASAGGTSSELAKWSGNTGSAAGLAQYTTNILNSPVQKASANITAALAGVTGEVESGSGIAGLLTLGTLGTQTSAADNSITAGVSLTSPFTAIGNWIIAHAEQAGFILIALILLVIGAFILFRKQAGEAVSTVAEAA